MEGVRKTQGEAGKGGGGGVGKSGGQDRSCAPSPLPRAWARVVVKTAERAVQPGKGMRCVHKGAYSWMLEKGQCEQPAVTLLVGRRGGNSLVLKKEKISQELRISEFFKDPINFFKT